MPHRSLSIQRIYVSLHRLEYYMNIAKQWGMFASSFNVVLYGEVGSQAYGTSAISFSNIHRRFVLCSWFIVLASLLHVV